ncbi:ABC transporter permease [Brenneria izbisi]|uniref:ABC transporter permease n=1 Tax=Brenneria izbisi TaxID=2939450 RepID=A0AA42C2C0_9GAMM|nr:ABC transporter permease [Brenneria izbisi]MCV9879008.1 ABC transporter permease [Brenneria izbisi]MCV9882328.1 ABC transporter permease [Brenneria izbisi]
MTRFQQLIEACRNLYAFRQRATLAILGIGVGSALVVTLLILGKSAQHNALSAFDTLGGDVMVADIGVRSAERSSPLPINLDFSSLRSQFPDIRRVVPVARWEIQLTKNGKALSIPIIATTSDFFDLLRLDPAWGRGLSKFDSRANYAVLGASLAQRLALSAKHLQLNHYAFDVIGILHPSVSLAPGGMQIDDMALVPLTTIKKIAPFTEPDMLLIQAVSRQHIALLETPVRDWLESNLPGRNIHLMLQQQLLDGIEQQTRTFRYLLSALAAIALLMGGIGVMNVMVMSVAERRHEIGLRQALGATSQEIGVLFLLEALLLSLPGSLLGSGIGVAFSWIYARYADWSLVIDLWVLPLAMGSALTLAVFFGLKPSLAAARLSPAEALRDA